MLHRPVARMSKTDGMATHTTFCDQDMPPELAAARVPPGDASAMSGVISCLPPLHGSQRLMVPSKTRARLIATNMMKVMNHGFWNLCSWPSVPTEDIVKQIFIVIVLRDPHVRSPKT